MFDATALHQVLFDELGLPADSEFAVAYSGGCDSHVLLHALAVLQAHAKFKLTALHFDHALVPQSDAWARHCGAVCRAFGIAFLSQRQALHKPPGESLEALARRSRYQWFAQVVNHQQVLLTAHHADDQAETVLLNLLRGGGVELLAGIPAQRFLSVKKATQVVRPLLSFSRASLAEYANRHQLTWIEDPSNQAEQFERNYLRHALFPLLRKRWPSAIASFANSARHCREAAEFLEQMVAPLLQSCLVREKMGVFCLAPPLALRALQPLGRFQIVRVIRYWLHQYGCRSPSATQLATFYQQVFMAASNSASITWQQATLRCFAGHLYLTKRLDDIGGTPLDWDVCTCEIGKNGICIEVLPTSPTHSNTQPGSLQQDTQNSNHAQNATAGSELQVLDLQRFRGKHSQLVWRQGGERIKLPGRKHRSKLKKLFQQNAIPPWERNALPLLMVDGEVAWAHGVGVSANYCCAPNQAGIRLRFVHVATS